MAKKEKIKKAHPLVKAFFAKLGENFLSVLPIFLIVTILFLVPGVVTTSSKWESYVAFVISSVFVGLGLSFFTMGVDESMSRIGQAVGESLFKKKNLLFIILMTFIIGVLVTVAEPDLSVMASQIGWEKITLIAFVGIGVGLFVVFGVLRILFGKDLRIMFICFYAIVFMLASIVDKRFLPIAFDSGGVTTGPVTVPFILAFGVGLAASKASNGRSGEDAFGLTALASVGPIVAVMVMSLFMDVDNMVYTPDISPLESLSGWGDFAPVFFSLVGEYILEELKNVAIAIAPLAIFFFIYNLVFLHYRWKQTMKIYVNLLYASFGLVMFLAAVNVGFLPTAQEIGKGIGSNPDLVWLAILVGGLFGIFGVIAEPAVHVLVHQVEHVSEGTISSKSVLVVLALAVGGGVALAVTRAYFGFTVLYYMVPGYLIALGLTFLVPKIFTSIAFDSGGVASGPMASTFVMPFVIGFTISCHGAESVYENAFGCVAMIALMPLIVVQCMGLTAKVKKAISYARTRKAFMGEDEPIIIDFTEERA